MQQRNGWMKTVIEALPSCFATEVHEETLSPEQPWTVEYIRYPLPLSEGVKAVRSAALGVLFDAIRTADTDEREEGYKVLENLLCGRPRIRGGPPGVLSAEAQKIAEFVRERSVVEESWRSINALERILDRLQAPEDGTSALAEQACKALSQRPFYPRYQLFERLIGWRNGPRDLNLAEEAEALTKGYSPAEIAEVLNEVLAHADPHYLYGSIGGLCRELGRRNFDEGRAFFRAVSGIGQRLPAYAGMVLKGLRLNNRERFRALAEELLTEDDPINRAALAGSYTDGSGETFDKFDMEILRWLAAYEDEALHAAIAAALANFSMAYAEATLTLLGQLRTPVSEALYENFARALFEFGRERLQQHLGQIEAMLKAFVRVPRLNSSPLASYFFETVLDAVYELDPEWVASFFEERIALKEGQSDVSYNPAPFDFHYLFASTPPEEKAKQALRRVRDWSLKGGFFLWEAAQFVKHLSRGIPFAWTAAVLEEWLIPGETQKIRCACRLLRQFRTDEAVLAFYQKAVDLGNREVWSEVAASVGTTGQAYVSQPGEPDPTLLAEIEVFQRLQAGTKNPAAQAFFQKRIEATRQAIQEMLEEEEEELLAVL